MKEEKAMYRDDAVRRLQEQEKKRDDVFCPVTKLSCNRNCECYDPGYVDGDPTYPHSYIIRSPRCTCFLLKGEVIHA
jgi:hypothetical protein